MEFEYTIVNHNRMARIHSALIADDHIRGPTQQVCDFPLTFIPPLCTDNYDVCQGNRGPWPLSSTNNNTLRPRRHSP